LLQRLGIDVESLGVPSDLEFARCDGRSRTGPITSLALEARLGAMVFSLLRPTLHAALLRLLPSESLHPGRELVGFEDDGERVRLRFADGGDAVADVLVGADGLTSAVRRQLWGERPVRSHGLVCIQGYAAWRGLPEREGQILHDVSRQFGHMPLLLESGLGRQWWYIERGAPGAPLPAGTRERIAAQLRSGGWRPELAELVLATEERVLLRRDIADRPPLDGWSRGRATLLGDAAHPTSPYAGYGAGMAIEDAWVLGGILADTDLGDTRAVGAALAAYEALRLRKTAQVSQLAWRLGRMFHSRSRLVRGLRDALLDRSRLGGYAIRRGYLSNLELEMKRL
jgi:2-polyprenyl-6-methoxyphenol hydroxylase-like FAD-dependent oxidoreductase